ncbi:DUF58 domain-containing protein [Jatrophihabitans fulvus]
MAPFRTGRRIGFTTRASCLLAAGLTAVVCGLVLGETDLVRAGVLAAAIPIAAAVVVHRSRVRIANRRTVEPRQAAAGQSVTTHLTITNRSRLPTGALMLEDQLPDRFTGRARFVLDSLRTGESRTVSYRLPALGRGRYRVGPLHVRLSDPFHMIDLTRSFTATTEFLVTPTIDQLPGAEPPRSDDLGDGAGSRSVGAHGADDASTREYRIGDDLRKIHWKSSARVGSLMVRQEERPWRSRSTLLLDLRAAAHVSVPATDASGAPIDPRDVDPRSLDTLEWAVSAAASIAMQSVRGRREIALLDDPARPEPLRLAGPNHLATHLATVRAVHVADLTPMAAQLRAAARESSLLAVLGRLDAATLNLLVSATPRGRSAPHALLIDTASWTAPGRGRTVREGDPTSDVRAAATALGHAGWRVAIVRRGTTTAQAWQLLSSVPTTGTEART